MPHKDPEERRRYNTEYRNRRYREDPAFRASRLRDRAERKKALKRWLSEYKSTLQCIKCGENHPACLEFHHRNPKEKKFEVTRAVNCLLSKERVLEEIAKCDVLCVNCHRKLHFSASFV
jgi:hypothetical protein